MMRGIVVAAALTALALVGCGKKKDGGGGGATATAGPPDAGLVVMQAQPMNASAIADAGAAAAGPPTMPKGRKDLTNYDLPLSVDLPADGFMVAAGTTEHGEAQVTIKKDKLEVLLTARDSLKPCDEKAWEADALAAAPKLKVVKREDVKDGFVVTYTKGNGNGNGLAVAGCVPMVRCEVEKAASEADAATAVGICKSVQ